MTYQFITARDFETTPARYAEYLHDTYIYADQMLSRPVQKWPAGDSHTISNAIKNECRIAILELNIDFGLFNAHGYLVDHYNAM